MGQIHFQDLTGIFFPIFHCNSCFVCLASLFNKSFVTSFLQKKVWKKVFGKYNALNMKMKHHCSLSLIL